jgi:hypothetical protein
MDPAPASLLVLFQILYRLIPNYNIESNTFSFQLQIFFSYEQLMIFLNYIAFNCSVCFLIIQLIIAVTSTIYTTANVQSFKLFSYQTMPVATPSQAKRLEKNFNGSSMIPTIDINNSTNINTTTSVDISINKFTSSALETTDISSELITPILQQSGSSFCDSDHFTNCDDREFQILKLSTALPLPRLISKFSNSSTSHNPGSSSVFKMESDCEDNASSLNTGSTQVDISKLFQQLSSQITSQNTVLQEQIQANNQKVLSDFQKLTQDTKDFKHNVKLKLKLKLKRLEI